MAYGLSWTAKPHHNSGAYKLNSCEFTKYKEVA